jgi:hypothetical protein
MRSMPFLITSNGSFSGKSFGAKNLAVPGSIPYFV